MTFLVLILGGVLGAITRFVLGREFAKHELGALAWPFTITYLASFLYVTSYLIFAITEGRRKYIIGGIWILTMALMFVGLVMAMMSGE